MRNEPQIPIMADKEPAFVEHLHGTIGRYGKTEIKTAEWRHIARCCFGEARQAGSHTWTGDAYRYDIFVSVTSEYCPREVAIRWQHGGGRGWIVTRDDSRNGNIPLPLIITQMPSEPERWNACHYICDAVEDIARECVNDEKQRIYQAFVDGRLKKRKVRGRVGYKVDILPFVTGQ